MTKWTDPIENPEQNERYWREKKRNGLIAATFIVYGLALYFGLLFTGCLS